MSLTLFGFICVVYYGLHSLLAVDAIKTRLYRTAVPKGWYRILFNILAVLMLIPLFLAFAKTDKSPITEMGLYLLLPGILFIIAGTIWIVRSFKAYDLSEFAGIAQLKAKSEREYASLNTNGLNSQVRHPLYFGSLLLVWGIFLVWPLAATLLFSIITTVYLYVGCLLEERKLVQRFGEVYHLYQKKVPMLLPLKCK
jgi:protein-S-isoprenylcysteine O-methyltransferase Ste14